MQHVRCRACKTGISRTQAKKTRGYCGDCWDNYNPVQKGRSLFRGKKK